ncbi:MAG TPA: hypothetical protein VK889_01475 [Solirubrobacterales bacterium]|nr:hypothetical protein [Solirubrobacterales bacterium]
MSDAGWAVREKVFWRFGDARRSAAEKAKAPVEGLSWGIRRGVVWRLQDRADSLGPLSRGLATGAVILLAAAAGVAGLLYATPDQEPGGETIVVTETAAPAPVAAPLPQTKPTPRPEPTLQGASPVFVPEPEGDHPAARKNGKGSATNAGAADSGPAQPLAGVLTSTGSKSGPAAAASKAREQGDAVAGPKALEVARRFSYAFVLYETGKAGQVVKQTFAETAAPELRKALLKRPPRQPANVKVPRAKVLNVVPGPAEGGVYSVSVALLRVGLTSELRLDLEPSKGKRWRVTDILG